MAIESSLNRVTYAGNGVTTSFPFSFKIFQSSDLRVVIRDISGLENVMTLNDNYTVSGAGNPSGGSVETLLAPLGAGELITIRRILPLTQETDIRNQGDFYPSTIEDTFDQVVMQNQQQQDEISRAIRLPETDQGIFSPILPTGIEDNPLGVLIINSLGTGFDVGPSATEVSNAQGYAVAANNSAVSALASSVSSASSAASALVSETNASASATNSAASAASALASKISATASEVSADASASSILGAVSSATTQATNAATSATAAAGSATAAGTSATNAANSATNAGTSATDAANSASSVSSQSAQITTNTNAISAHAALTTSVHGIADTANLVTKTGTETLTNKTLTTPIVDASLYTGYVSTPSNPASGKLKVYSKTDDKLYYLNSTGLEKEVGSGGGGSTNFITGGDGEGFLTGFNQYNDGAVAAPIDGTGGTGLLTITQSSTNPLFGTKSFIITKPASNCLGHGISKDFTIDSGYQAKVLTISLDYKVDSGSFQAGSSSQVSDLTVWIVDLTSGQVIQPSSYKLLSNSTTIADKFVANFQTASNSTSYRLILHAATTNTAAFDLKFDNVTVSPSNYVYGSPVTDWVSYTPTYTNLGTVSYSSVRYRRVGDSIQIFGGLTTGTTTSGTAKISLPAGLTADTSKMSNTSMIVGDAVRFFSTASNRKRAKLIISPTDVNSLFFSNDDYSTAASPGGGLDGNALFASGEGISIQAMNIPILGWSSSVQMSDGYDGRVVAAILSGSTTVINASGAAIVPTTVLSDTHGAMSGANFIVPVAGYYAVDAYMFGPSVAYVNGDALQLGVQANGVYTSLALTRPATATISLAASGSTTLGPLTAGSTIRFMGYTNGSGAIGAFNASIKRVSGPTTISATESVNLRYNTGVGQATTANAEVTVLFGSKSWDSHGAYNPSTGIFTAPVAGKYRINATIQWTNPASNMLRFLGARNNVATPISFTTMFQFTGSGSVTQTLTDTLDLKAGETFVIKVNPNSTASNLSTDPYYNYLTVERVGL